MTKDKALGIVIGEIMESVPLLGLISWELTSVGGKRIKWYDSATGPVLNPEELLAVHGGTLKFVDPVVCENDLHEYHYDIVIDCDVRLASPDAGRIGVDEGVVLVGISRNSVYAPEIYFDLTIEDIETIILAFKMRCL